MPRSNTARPSNRSNTAVRSSKDALAVVRPNEALGLESKPAANRIYGETRISGKSHTVQGDVINTYNHFYGDKLAWSDTDNPGVAETSGISALYIASKFRGLAPESISRYDAQQETWLRSVSRLSTTCEWIFENEKYKNWESGRGPPILIWTGPVGCGKSIAASAVIDRLDADQSDKHAPVISYFVDAARTERVTTREILLALIKQMMLIHYVTRGQLSPETQQTIGTCLWESDDVLTLATLTQIAIDLIQQQGDCSFVIDGIDAMEEPDILAFIGLLPKIFARSDGSNLSCKLMLFCRETLGRGIRLQSVAQACIFDTQAVHVRRDIRLYVDHEVNSKQMERSISTDDALINKVRKALKENAERMFLWVRLQILTIWDLNHTTCDQDIEDQLCELPEGLDDIYLRCLNRIDTSNEKRSEDIAPKVFKWVACAKEPLTQLQAREAVSLTCHNLPLRKSKVLSSPVTDYCANLVTLNHLTGTVTFPHPTVKDFLCDLSKLPPHLHKYHIAPEADDLWIGEICMAYAKILPAARSLIQQHKPKFDSRVPSSILQNTFITSLPFRWPRKRSNPPKKSIEVPVVPRPPQGLIGSDFSLHEYMCKHWLEHNRRTRQNGDPAYKSFTEICLRHDAELQPWTEGSGSEVERYQRTVQHGVMTNHGPLLLVVSEHLEPFKKSLCAQVFLRPCPGTDSSFLHVAAALGHLDVLPVLRRHCGETIANSRSQSPAGVAVENFQQAAFEMLCSPWLSNLAQHLEYLEKGSTVEECVLLVCAAYGNVDAMEYILRNIDPNPDLDLYRDYLHEAFFIACFKGHTAVASGLVSYGVEADHFQSDFWFPEISRLVDGASWEALKPCTPYSGSSLNLALQLESSAFMEHLLASGASFSAYDYHCDVLDVFEHYGEHQDLRDAARFIEILTRHGQFLKKVRPPEEVIWPQHMVKIMLEAQPLKPLVSLLQIQNWSRFMRMIMYHSIGRINSDIVGVLRFRISGGPDSVMRMLLNQAHDDVLLRMLSYQWFDEEFLLQRASLSALLERGTSRCMEALIDCLGISHVLLVQAFCLTDRCLPLVDLLDFWSCGSEECRKARERAPHCTTWQALSALDNAESVQSILNQEQIHRVQCYCRSAGYYDVLKSATKAALLDGRHQILDFISCYAHCQRKCIDPGHRPSSTLCTQPVFHEEVSASDRPRYLPLMWHRCYNKAGSDVPKARQMYTELSQAGSQANFALNWPTRYLRAAAGSGYESQSGSARITAVKLSIKLAFYHWNFRLNRSKGNAFSSADEWFMGVKLVLGIRDRH